MTNIASLFGNNNSTDFVPPPVGQRRVVALVGIGEGPKVAFRAKKVCVRICGLTEGGKLFLEIDDTEHVFEENGEHIVLGGEFAKARSVSEKPVICELLIDS